MPKPTEEEKHKYMFSDDMQFLQKAIILHPASKKHFLMIKRKEDLVKRPGEWDLPGGNVLYSVSAKDSLTEKIKSEVNLDAIDFKPMYVRSRYNEKKGIYYLFIGYLAKSLNPNYELGPEHEEGRWVMGEDFLNLDPKPADALNKMVEKFIEYNAGDEN